MKVMDLIKELKQYDENLEVYFQETLKEGEEEVFRGIVSSIDGVLEAHDDDNKTTMIVFVSEDMLKLFEEESEGKGMYIACKKCKYNHNGECDFYYMGSGNEIDMPCYREKELIKKAADNFLQAFVKAESEESK
jgi:hypothetical protein